jgi:predicted DCC family thiol-disulfide oxidoreductase YuxK
VTPAAVGGERIVSPAPRPLLVYDGDCALCRRWVERWRRVTGEAVEFAPYQQVAGRYPEVPAERFHAAVQLRAPDGRWYQAAEAVFRSIAHRRAGRWLLALYQVVPGFAPLCEWGYRRVARNRGRLGHGER